jgi:ABC-type polysaccharide/polyol phosphate export permease
MKKFAIQAWLTYKALLYWYSLYALTGDLLNIFGRPAIQIIIFALLGKFAMGKQGAQILALGFSVQLMQGTLISGLNNSYSSEIWDKTLSFLYISPVNRFMNFISRSVFHFPAALLSLIAGLFTAWIIVGLNFGTVNWVGFITSILIIATAITGFAQLLGVYALAFKENQSVLGLAGGLLGLMTGCIIPISVYPAPIQELAKLLPITNGLFAIRATFTGAPMADVYGYVLREALTGIIYFLVAIVAFRYIELWAKRTGALSVES